MADSSDDEIVDDSIVGRFLSGFTEEEFVATCGMHKSVFSFLWDKYSHEARDDSPLKYPLRRRVFQFYALHTCFLLTLVCHFEHCRFFVGTGIICTK